jgi:hypothetical protein
MEETQNPISYIRTTPINSYARDLLQGAQDLLFDSDNVLFARIFSAIFTSVSAKSLDVLDHVSLCTHQSLCLKHYALDQAQSDARRDMAHQASEIYALEVNRLLGSLFSFDHPFWTCYYDRHNDALHAEGQMSDMIDIDQASITYHLQRHYSMFYVPLDCMYYLAGEQQHPDNTERHRGLGMQYEMIMQSMRWLLVALFIPKTIKGFNRTDAYRKAISLVNHLDIPLYKDFIIQKMHDKTVSTRK